jgi:hypothetical protein
MSPLYLSGASGVCEPPKGTIWTAPNRKMTGPIRLLGMLEA